MGPGLSCASSSCWLARHRLHGSTLGCCTRVHSLRPRETPSRCSVTRLPPTWPAGRFTVHVCCWLLGSGFVDSGGLRTRGRRCALRGMRSMRLGSARGVSVRAMSCGRPVRAAVGARPTHGTSSRHRSFRSHRWPPPGCRIARSVSGSISRIGPSNRICIGCIRSSGSHRGRNSPTCSAADQPSRPQPPRSVRLSNHT